MLPMATVVVPCLKGIVKGGLQVERVDLRNWTVCFARMFCEVCLG